MHGAGHLEGGYAVVGAGQRLRRREGAVRVQPEQVDAAVRSDDSVRDAPHAERVDAPGAVERAGGASAARLRRRREGAVLVHADHLDGVVCGRGRRRVRAVPDGNGVDARGTAERAKAARAVDGRPGRDQPRGGVV